MVRSLQTVLVIRVSLSSIAATLLQQFTPPNIVLNHFMAEVIVFPDTAFLADRTVPIQRGYLCSVGDLEVFFLLQ